MASASPYSSRRHRLLGAALTALLLAGGCSKTEFVPDPGLEALELLSVNPEVVLPGSRLVIGGRSFVTETLGTSRLHLAGLFRDSSGEREVDVIAPARFIDFDRMEVEANSAFLGQFGGSYGEFNGLAYVEVESKVDGQIYESAKEFVVLQIRDVLAPRLDTVTADGLIFVNDKIVVEGYDLLLGGGEGTTYASITGCFTPEGDTVCAPISSVDAPVTPASEFDRTSGTFPFSPAIAGIAPGRFEGTVALRNDHQAGQREESDERPVRYDLAASVVFSVSPTGASLGQYVDVIGGGFLGGEGGGVTLIELAGTFTPDGSQPPRDVQLVLVPEFVEGRLVRYVMNEDDALGDAVDLRKTPGMFSGEITPIVSYEGQEIRGGATPFDLQILPVKQVVYLEFSHTYHDSLRHFGLRAVDQQIRQRILEVIKRDYATVNLEARLEKPTDFALYSTVEINGVDPNGIGLLGYDNSPGKDTGNIRLHDHVGGDNAQTREDGYPAYGGVFIESLFAFSMHPGSFADSNPIADEAFDDTFDPFRPDVGGTPVTSKDLAGGGVPALTGPDVCPSANRQDQIACAIWVLGSMIGSTLSHEVGHSLGLANPFGQGFHNPSDGESRLMDSGGDRPFAERAELFGTAPGRFCDAEYEYLREILPTDEPEDQTFRPSCF